jgi:hypothetical protein
VFVVVKINAIKIVLKSNESGHLYSERALSKRKVFKLDAPLVNINKK